MVMAVTDHSSLTAVDAKETVRPEAMRMLRLSARASALAASMLVASTLGADELKSFDVAFSAPEGCSIRQSFVEQVLARTNRARSSGHSADYRFTLSITDTEQGPRGELLIRSPDGAEDRRDVPGPDCVSVVEAAALIAALVLDPRAVTGPLPAAASFPAPDEPPPAQSAPQSAPNASFESPMADVPAEPAPILTEDSGGRFAIAGGAALYGGVAPQVAPGIWLGMAWADQRTHAIAPMLGVDAQVASASAARAELGNASFTLLAARLWGCPLHWQDASATVALRPCASFDAGFVRAAGSETFEPRTHDSAWFAAGAFGRFDWMASRRVSFELRAGALFPLFQDRYVFDRSSARDELVHEVPYVALAASAGAALWLD